MLKEISKNRLFQFSYQENQIFKLSYIVNVGDSYILINPPSRDYSQYISNFTISKIFITDIASSYNRAWIKDNPEIMTMAPLSLSGRLGVEIDCFVSEGEELYENIKLYEVKTNELDSDLMILIDSQYLIIGSFCIFNNDSITYSDSTNSFIINETNTIFKNINFSEICPTLIISKDITSYNKVDFLPFSG